MSDSFGPDMTEEETELWERYLAGELSPVRIAQLHDVIQRRGENARLLPTAAAAFKATPDTDLSRLWLDRLHRRLQTDKTTARHERPQTRSLWIRFPVPAVAIAAALLMLVLPHAWRTPNVARMATYTAPAGERATIELADGTIVSLNVASTIQVPQDFGKQHRTVYLHGEADFRVTQHAGTPFVVDAGGTRAAVLGTEFGVRAYTPGVVRIAVRTGRVMVQSIVLGARDVATVTTSGVELAHNKDLDAALAFAQGRLVLNNVPLQDALPDLERWYDVKIHLQDPSIGTIPVHAALTNGAIGDLMEALQVTLGLHVTCEGRTLTLDRR